MWGTPKFQAPRFQALARGSPEATAGSRLWYSKRGRSMRATRRRSEAISTAFGAGEERGPGTAKGRSPFRSGVTREEEQD